MLSKVLNTKNLVFVWWLSTPITYRTYYTVRVELYNNNSFVWNFGRCVLPENIIMYVLYGTFRTVSFMIDCKRPVHKTANCCLWFQRRLLCDHWAFSQWAFSFCAFFVIDGPVPLPNMPNQIMNRMQVSQGTSRMFSVYLTYTQTLERHGRARVSPLSGSVYIFVIVFFCLHTADETWTLTVWILWNPPYFWQGTLNPPVFK